jgi:tetrahydromethanopterin S-methyltransferase subunit F
VTSTFRTVCATALIVLAVAPSIAGGAQAPPASIAMRVAPAQTAPAANDASAPIGDGKKSKSIFAEDGPVDTTWTAQVESFWHAVVRLPVAALLSAVLAFRPRRRGTPKRQGPVIQTQIVLALVGAMVMMVVGASLARAFGIVGAAGLIRYRAKVEDPKDAGVMLSTLAIGLASGVGLYLFAVFATGFVFAVLLVIESIDPDPYSLFNLTITTKDSTGLKDLIEGVFRRRRIPYELRSTATEEICYEVKLPLTTHTDTISDALVNLKAAKAVDVKWEPKKDAK